MDHHTSANAPTVHNESRTRLRSSSPSEQGSVIDTVRDDDTKSSKSGRRHSSSLSAIVGSLGTRLKRSSSSVTSSTGGRISSTKDMTGNLSTPTKRKNSATSKITSDSTTSVKSSSRRSSTPIDQRIDTSVSTSRGKKTSLRGIFSSARKFSLQSNPNVAEQLPPLPPQLRKGSYQDSQSSNVEVVPENLNPEELIGTRGTDAGIRNGTNGSISTNTRPPGGSGNALPLGNNNFSDRRARMHKHSLQQGNKWKLLQQKVLGNVDEENDDEQEFLQNINHGKM